MFNFIFNFFTVNEKDKKILIQILFAKNLILLLMQKVIKNIKVNLMVVVLNMEVNILMNIKMIIMMNLKKKLIN